MLKHSDKADKKSSGQIVLYAARFMKSILAAVFIGLMALFLLWMYAIAPRMDERFQLSELGEFDYAHRGLHNHDNGIIENTLEAFQLAAESGYGVELDLQLTKDGQVVVYHDKDLDRLCNDKRLVRELTTDELRGYTLLDSDQKIPTFKEALQAVEARVPIIIEIKAYNAPEEICPLVWETLKDYDGLYCIESFHPQVIQWFKENQPQVIRGQLMNARLNGSSSQFELFVRQNLCSNFLSRPDFTAYDCRARQTPAMWVAKNLFGMPEISWTVRDEDTYRKLKDENCVIIFEGFLPDNSENEESRKTKAVGGYVVPALE